MDPSTIAVEPRRAKPAWWWTLVTLVAGGAGALGTVAVAGTGTYEVSPFIVELRAKPAVLGKTVLEVAPKADVPGIARVRAEAGTHKAPIEAHARIVGVTSFLRADQRLLASPHDLATFVGREGKDAIQSFVIKVAGLASAGGAAAGLLVSFGRWRRIAGGLIGGVLTAAIIGLLMQQTYDTGEFRKTSFVATPGIGVPGGVPTLPP